MPKLRTGYTDSVRVFEHIAIDAGGPFEVKNGRNRLKVWILVFVCLTFKAVHIEVLQSMDGDSFLMAFYRFASRRGRPQTVRSDNGTNFVLGQKLIAKTWEEWFADNGEEFRSKFPEITWKFTPPGGPHFNGVCERMIGSAKRAMAAIMTPGLTNLEEFETVVVKAEGILNSRPLTYVSGDDKDLRTLCPNDFLIGRVARDMSPFATDGWSIAKKLTFVNELLDMFWRRFVAEMIPSMHTMNKWTRSTPNLRVGDIVVTLESKVRGDWPLAKIEEVTPGEDGKVREAMVLQDGKVARRPLSRLMLLLPAEDWDPSL
jgi:hypothetical protein